MILEPEPAASWTVKLRLLTGRTFPPVNTDTILRYNSSVTPGGPWFTPDAVTASRFLRFSAQFDF